MGPIGVFDSGYGGLTVLKSLQHKLPKHDFLYLGDNARTPYGSRSFETIYQYTLEAVQYLLKHDCPLVILACNTASAKALRTIQQIDLPRIAPDRRVLGVIRPTAEVIGSYSKSNHIGVLGTSGTIKSQSYVIEIGKQFTQLKVQQQECPLWVPLIENGELRSEGTDFFVKKYLDELFSKDPKVDTILLACTHYPLLLETIKKYTPKHVTILSQGPIVADSLADYLLRHTEINKQCTQKGITQCVTTDNAEEFNKKSLLFFNSPLSSKNIHL